MIDDIRELTLAELDEIVGAGHHYGGGVQQGINIGIGSINIDSNVATQINIAVGQNNGNLLVDIEFNNYYN
jgi:hypothetical protein